jgi:hypothetical protein
MQNVCKNKKLRVDCITPIRNFKKETIKWLQGFFAAQKQQRKRKPEIRIQRITVQTVKCDFCLLTNVLERMKPNKMKN